MFGFEKLEAWQSAIEFADIVYAETRGFPASERLRLTKEMRHAAVSVSSHIAEGGSRGSRNEFARSVEIAEGSIRQVISHCRFARKRGYFSQDQFEILRVVAEDQCRMLSGLRRLILNGG